MLFDLSKQALGDQRPSEALTEMRSLCRLPPDTTGYSKKNDILLAVWLRRLPDPVHAAITNFSDFTNDNLAASADGLLDDLNDTSCSLIHTTTPPDPPDEDHLLPNPPDHHTMTRSPPSPGPKILALDHRMTPPSPPSGGLTSLRNCATNTPVLALLPRNARNHVPGQKMYCEVAALGGGLCLHQCFLYA